MWVRSDLRRRWRSWVVLGLLVGATTGVGAAGVAGARRTRGAVPKFVAAAGLPDAAVLANNPAFDAAQRRRIASLPEVRAGYPFQVAFGLDVDAPRGLQGPLLPTAPQSQRLLAGVLLSGRYPAPGAADEAVIDENVERQFRLSVGSTIIVGQHPRPGDLASLPPAMQPQSPDPAFTARLRVVGISKAVSSDASFTPGSAFYVKYQAKLVGLINEFVALRRGQADFARFQQDAIRVTGMPLNVESADDLFGLRKARAETNLEADGLLLFALAAIVVGGVLVGQALVRSVTAGAADLAAWRAIGADARVAVPGMALPASVTAVSAGITSIAVAIALSSRFPIGVGRRYDLDVGWHADWAVLGVAVAAAVVATMASAFVAAGWRVRRQGEGRPRASRRGDWVAGAGLPPAMVIGSRLAVEPGHGRNAVPVRSALVGAIVGVLGVAGCLTFRAGIDDAVHQPRRSGVVWDYVYASGEGAIAPRPRAAMVRDHGIQAITEGKWARALPINGVPTPVFGVSPVKGSLGLVVLEGHAPTRADEIAFAPTTMTDLKLHVGSVIKAGAPPRSMRVVAEALLPETSHTSYDQSGWVTGAALHQLAPALESDSNSFEDYFLVRFAPHAAAGAVERRLGALATANDGYGYAATVPTTVIDLGQMRTLPLALGLFFALLAAATVAHALVTTVRRRNRDLAVLRSMGFTRRESRVAIAWQATLLALAGLVVGLPVGLSAGRFIWRWLADNFPIEYVAPAAVVALLLIVPVAIAVANALAAGPARAATRIAPAEVLRSE